MTDPSTTTSTSTRTGAREALWATGALLLLFAVGKPIAPLFGPFDKLVYTLMVGFQLYVPLWLIQRAGELPESHHIHAHGAVLGPVAALRRFIVLGRRARRAGGKKRGAVLRTLAAYGRGAVFRPRAFFADLGRALAAMGLTFPFFAIAHHLWQTRVMHLHGYRLSIPSDTPKEVLTQLFLIALPEELFYRGFLETRLERLWPTRMHVWVVPLSRTVFVASALFALGHFLGEWNPARLGPFFPAFVFSALTRKSGSIAGAVAYHGASNAFSRVLFAGYWR